MIDPREVANVDPALWHPLLRVRWTLLQPALEQLLRCKLRVVEGYRPDARQAWLYGAGRTTDQVAAKGLDPKLARPWLPRVTNAWSAFTSAHGWRENRRTPAACALDVVPLGPDGDPWSSDDPWDQFVAATDDAADALVLRHRLVHFKAPGKQVWDKPHLQLLEWSDVAHRLLLSAATSIGPE